MIVWAIKELQTNYYWGGNGAKFRKNIHNASFILSLKNNYKEEDKKHIEKMFITKYKNIPILKLVKVKIEEVEE